MLIPLAIVILVINAMLIREMRRASHNAATNLGHHQSTSSQSAVPTVMLVTTSLVYLVLRGSVSIVFLIRDFILPLYLCYWIVEALSRFVYAYNFYVYLITGKQFRSDLRALFCRCSFSPPPPAPAVDAPNRNDIRLEERAGQAGAPV